VSSETENSIRALLGEVSELRRQLQEGGGDRAVRDKAFDQLYDELKQYKEDFIFQAEKPLLLDLLLFYDSLSWFQESLLKQEMSPDVLADSFQYLLDEFLEVLYRRDVVPLDEAAVFDRTLHKAVKMVETDEEARDQEISRVLKRGFGRADKVLRPTEVVILRYRGRKD
jgi:molecular chaperone GrpE (heat shock protein)